MITETGLIISNRCIAQNLWRLEIEVPEIAGAQSQPGQFIEILVNPTWERPLRCPMSIAGIQDDTLTIIYKTIGISTHSLATKQSGETISVIGPLGNSFSVDGTGSIPVLVAGGAGLPPLLWLHQILTKQNILHYLIIGAQTGEEHFIKADEHKNIFLTTDDGSLGRRGTVMLVVESIIDKTNNIHIYACGPEAMLAAVQDTAFKHNIGGQLSTESYMACGLGICQGCVVKRRDFKPADHSYNLRYALVCKDGPVFNMRELYFD